VRTPHFTVASNSAEKQARRIANQFEEIRAVFQKNFPNMRLDPGEPLIILAVKNEDSLKVLLPDYWASKERAHPGGIYVAGMDESFAALRTDVTGSAENPYHLIYHEYTHAILRLNFASLPVWLNEGMAEFYGGTVQGNGHWPPQRRTTGSPSTVPIHSARGVDERGRALAAVQRAQSCLHVLRGMLSHRSLSDSRPGSFQTECSQSLSQIPARYRR
jgi:hypothetical protein